LIHFHSQFIYKCNYYDRLIYAKVIVKIKVAPFFMGHSVHTVLFALDRISSTKILIRKTLNKIKNELLSAKEKSPV